jgi:hypothetical protein
MYLTPEDYEIAIKNGISKRTAYKRFYELFWTKERAITEPVRKSKVSLDPHWYAIALSNGISDSCFRYRMKKKWPLELAATTQPGTYVGRYARKQSLVER